ncbi:LysR substrate-binding domain-containing protein [Ramlibacter rhizophilus]|uniref:LysR family transcriptional regulator n=1 Tax=Ramlibacter rhizophilus TaxID=1781167 RepID=A0A4Z0BTB1_9BURK|nr:LysR substrate-binding domain-containing protein [Ramlibacter rhizophilus]TFZ01265.1 LysR family transcriptional regulator [Ramlibacter rhizophilus]
MKLNQLRDMVAIVERGSLRGAARHLDIAQSALTRSIRELERELGGTLFERDAKGMLLTPLGRLFFQRASSAMNELRRAREEVEQARGGTGGTVVAALSIMPHVGMLPGALTQFRKRFPGVVLKLIEGLYPTVEPGLRDGTIDFYLGAATPAPPAPGLVAERLFDNTRLVVGRKGHPLATARSLKALAQAEWLTPSLSYDAAEDLNALFAAFKLPAPRITLQAHSAMTVLVALASTDLLAMLPKQWNEFPLTQGALQVIPVREKLAAPSIVFVRRGDLPLTPAAEYFCDMLRRYAPQ